MHDYRQMKYFINFDLAKLHEPFFDKMLDPDIIGRRLSLKGGPGIATNVWQFYVSA